MVVFIDHPFLGDKQLPMIDQFPELRILSLGNTQVSDASMTRISRLTHLHFLDIAHTQVTDAGLLHLAKLPALKWLWVGKWDAPRVTVSDSGLKQIAPALDLERLQVLGHGFTDASIPTFERFKNLRELARHQRRTSATHEKAAELRDMVGRAMTEQSIRPLNAGAYASQNPTLFGAYHAQTHS